MGTKTVELKKKSGVYQWTLEIDGVEHDLDFFFEPYDPLADAAVVRFDVSPEFPDGKSFVRLSLLWTDPSWAYSLSGGPLNNVLLLFGDPLEDTLGKPVPAEMYITRFEKLPPPEPTFRDRLRSLWKSVYGFFTNSKAGT